MATPKTFNTAEVAKKLGVHRSTLLRWFAQKRISVEYERNTQGMQANTLLFGLTGYVFLYKSCQDSRTRRSVCTRLAREGRGRFVEMRGYVYILSNPSMPGLAAHGVLDEHRVSTNREFFRVSMRRAITEILPVLGDYTLVDVKASHGIEKIEADLRERRAEQQAIIRAQENKRAWQERERAREKTQRIAELQRQFGYARARLSALGPRPGEPHVSGLTSFLILCWMPVPFGWLVWVGSLAAFSGPHYEVGYVCIALLVVGFFVCRKNKWNDAAYSKAIEPFLAVGREIENLETAIKNAGASLDDERNKPIKTVVPCPKCKTRLSLATGKTGNVECPKCGAIVQAAT